MLQSLLKETVQVTRDERTLVLNSAADPCVPALAHQFGAGELLLAEDSIAAYTQAQTAIRQLNTDNLYLRQVAFHKYTLHEMPVTMNLAVMNILYQPGNAWMRYDPGLAAYALKSGGRLYIEFAG